jgi:rhodanese-related sulfurtransferase
MANVALTPTELQRRIAPGLVATASQSQAVGHAPLILDLRPPRQFHRSHIPGSSNSSLALLLSGEPPQQDLILISQRGQVDEAVAAGLHDNGFHRRIEHLEGGLEAWTEAGLPLVVAETEQRATLAELNHRLKEPWLLSLMLLAVAITLQHGGIPLVVSSALLWVLLATTSLFLQRGSKQLLRRWN